MSAVNTAGGGFTQTPGSFFLDCSRCETLTRLLPTASRPCGHWFCGGCNEPASEDVTLVECRTMPLRDGIAEITIHCSDKSVFMAECCHCKKALLAQRHEYENKDHQGIFHMINFTRVTCPSCHHGCCSRCPRFEIGMVDVFDVPPKYQLIYANDKDADVGDKEKLERLEEETVEALKKTSLNDW